MCLYYASLDRDASFDNLVSFLSHFLLFALKKLVDLVACQFLHIKLWPVCSATDHE